MLTKITLVLVSLHIGALVGAVGVGGVFLPGALSAIAGLPLRQSMATALFTFIFTGIAGTAYFQRRGSIDWAVARPVGAGAALAGWAGARVNTLLSAPALALILAAIIVFAGLSMFGRPHSECGARTAPRWPLLAALGAVVGFASGLTGVGGPVLSVPLLVMCGFPVLTAIGVSQVVQIVGALSGTAANAQLGIIDYPLAALVGLAEMAGVIAGAHLIHRVETHIVKRLAGALCVAVGLLFMWRGLNTF